MMLIFRSLEIEDFLNLCTKQKTPNPNSAAAEKAIKMKVRAINRDGYMWIFDTVKQANQSLKSGWRKNAEKLNDGFETYLEIWLNKETQDEI